jgi:TonB family protein
VTAAPFIADVIAFSAQVAFIVAIATIVALIVRIDAAAVRYQYWRALLALCLLLPLLQRRQTWPMEMDGINEVIASAPLTVTPVANTPQVAAAIPWVEIVAWLFVVGIVIRLARIGLGLLRLRAIRRSGCLSPPDAEHEDLQWALGTDAEIRYVSEGQPITCGAWRPVVLLPASLLSQPQAIQRAVLAHELIHVQRRDWIWMMGEEVLCAMFWFHPAIWWVVSRVRRAREEAVDELTVLATGQRRAYLEALLAFADAAPVVPGAAFARRTHLFRRMRLISKEAVMSSKRVVASCAVLALAVVAGSWYAVGAFPMMRAQAPGVVQPAAQTSAANAAGPLEQRAKPITLENPIPRRTFSIAPQNPGDATNGAVVVMLRVVIDRQGRVGEVRAINTARAGVQYARGFSEQSAPPTFVKAAADAVRQWQYDPPADGPIAFDVMFAFAPGKEGQLLQHGDSRPLLARDAQLVVERGRGGAPVGVIGGVVGGVPAPPPPPPPPPPPGWGQGAVRVGSNVAQPTKTKHVNPEYPAIAQSSRVQGVVIMEAIIGPDGHVQDARILRSVPLLDQAALDAVKQWEFTPTLLNGAPVPVIMTVTVQFTLS